MKPLKSTCTGPNSWLFANQSVTGYAGRLIWAIAYVNVACSPAIQPSMNLAQDGGSLAVPADSGATASTDHNDTSARDAGSPAETGTETSTGTLPHLDAGDMHTGEAEETPEPEPSTEPHDGETPQDGHNDTTQDGHTDTDTDTDTDADSTNDGTASSSENPLGSIWPPANGNFSTWVSPDGVGGLAYRTTTRGDRIPDFSYAGFGGGGVAFPDAPVVQVLDPVPNGDDTARIQAAIDAASALAPNAEGMRGVVRLNRGEYRIGGQLRIAASGVILRGQGRGEDGTVLRATGTDMRTLIVLGGQGNPREVEGTRRAVVSAYVPVGAKTIEVNDVSGYAIGQRVMVERPSTQEWLDYIGMDDCDSWGTSYDTSDVNDRTCLEVPWEVGRRELRFDRIVTDIRGNEITLDAPLTMALDADFGGGFIYQFDFPGRIYRSGIERLRGESDYNGPDDEDHSWSFIEFTAIEDAWVDRIVAKYFAYAAVNVQRWSRRVTVQDSRCIKPISLIDGRRRYSFKIERATLILVQRCETREGRHDFVLGQLTVGPNVFLDSISEDAYSDVGPHAGWSPGVLFDGISTDKEINIRNRGNSGTNHGWVSANSVVWNAEAPEMRIESPPGSQNWCIGCITQNRRGDGIWESAQRFVWPDSLYLAQLQRRLGTEALVAIGALE